MTKDELLVALMNSIDVIEKVTDNISRIDTAIGIWQRCGFAPQNAKRKG